MVADGALFDHAVTLVIEATDASPPVEVATLHGAFSSGWARVARVSRASEPRLRRSPRAAS